MYYVSLHGKCFYTDNVVDLMMMDEEDNGLSYRGCSVQVKGRDGEVEGH